MFSAGIVLPRLSPNSSEKTLRQTFNTSLPAARTRLLAAIVNNLIRADMSYEIKEIDQNQGLVTGAMTTQWH